MRSLTAVALVLACAAAIHADDRSPEAVRSAIDALRPGRLTWQEIDWKDCPREALRASAETHKPILVWVFLGKPKDERC